MKLKTIFFDLDFKYIFICRFLPFLLPGPAATSVLFCLFVFALENLLEMVLLNLILFSWG